MTWTSDLNYQNTLSFSFFYSNTLGSRFLSLLSYWLCFCCSNYCILYGLRSACVSVGKVTRYKCSHLLSLSLYVCLFYGQKCVNSLGKEGEKAFQWSCGKFMSSLTGSSSRDSGQEAKRSKSQGWANYYSSFKWQAFSLFPLFAFTTSLLHSHHYYQCLIWVTECNFTSLLLCPHRTSSSFCSYTFVTTAGPFFLFSLPLSWVRVRKREKQRKKRRKEDSSVQFRVPPFNLPFLSLDCFAFFSSPSPSFFLSLSLSLSLPKSMSSSSLVRIGILYSTDENQEMQSKGNTSQIKINHSLSLSHSLFLQVYTMKVTSYWICSCLLCYKSCLERLYMRKRESFFFLLFLTGVLRVILLHGATEQQHNNININSQAATTSHKLTAAGREQLTLLYY